MSAAGRRTDTFEVRPPATGHRRRRGDGAQPEVKATRAMKCSSAMLISLPSATIIGGSVCALVARSRLNRWGATDEEARRPLPGDEIARASEWGFRLVSTRAISIDAPPEAVWPWLVQMGSGRAGFYTHEWVERLMGITYADGHAATSIHPEFQQLQAGDRVPYSRFNTVAVTAFDPPRLLMAGEWFVLEPLEGGTRTRLLVRTRGGWLEPFARRVPVVGLLLAGLATLIDRGPGELLHAYMEIGMLNGIKRRAERYGHPHEPPHQPAAPG